MFLPEPRISEVDTFIQGLVLFSFYLANPLCTKEGMFLPDPRSSCGYLVCVTGSDPWPNSNGVVTMVTKTLKCSKGLAVSSSFKGGLANPCTVRTDTCGEYSVEVRTQ